jgi:hypothetical protein
VPKDKESQSWPQLVFSCMKMTAGWIGMRSQPSFTRRGSDFF